MSTSSYQQPYNISLPSFSPVLTYTPWRDGDVTQGWNSSYTGLTPGSSFNLSSNNGYNYGQGIAFRTTEYSGAAVSVDFEGTAVYLCLVADDSVTYVLTVDNETVQAIEQDVAGYPDSPCGVYGSNPQVLLSSGNLTYGAHQATLQATIPAAGLSISFYGAIVTISAGSPGPKLVKVVDDTDPGWTFAPESDWILEADDEYSNNGNYHATSAYNAETTASYTFQGANAVTLRSLSMFNYFGYTVALDNNPEVTFNASDLYWRHDGVVLFFAGGLDPSESHTITLTNYDANQPVPVTTAKNGGQMWASVDTLWLVMDDIASQDALIASVQSSSTTSPSAAGEPYPIQSVSSSFPASAVAAVVLGVCLLLLIGLNGILFYRQKRPKSRPLSLSSPRTSATMVIPTPFTLSATLTTAASQSAPSTELHSRTENPFENPSSRVSWGETQRTTALPDQHSTNVATSIANPPVTSSVFFQRREKIAQRRAGQAGFSVEMRPLPSHSRESGVDQGSEDGFISEPNPDPKPSLLELVTNLSRLVKGQLRQEFLEREGVDPPDYHSEDSESRMIGSSPQV